MRDYYAILEVSPSASLEVIRASYRALGKRYHPDNRETGDAERFRLVKEALDVLSDEQKRAVYDGMRQQNGRSNGHAAPQGKVWVNGIGWCTPDASHPQPPPNAYPQPYPQQFDPDQFAFMIEQAAAQVGHSMVDSIIDQLMHNLRRGRR